MKKLLLLAGVVASLSFASCKSDYVCDCGTDGGKTYFNASGSKAKALCEGNGVTVKDEDGEEIEQGDCTLEKN